MVRSRGSAARSDGKVTGLEERYNDKLEGTDLRRPKSAASQSSGTRRRAGISGRS